MAGVNEKDLTAARAYSCAILQLAEENGEADLLLDELVELVALLDGNAELDDFFSSPMVDADARQKAMERIFRGKISDLLMDSLQVLNRKERLGSLRAVAEMYRLVHAEARGLVDVRVTTAVELTDRLRETLKQVADARTGKNSRLVETIDESLLGGLVIQIGDQKIDASVSSRLDRLSGLLEERAAQEIYSGKDYVEVDG